MIVVQTFVDALVALDKEDPFTIPHGSIVDLEETRFLLRKVANTGWLAEENIADARWDFRKRAEGDPGFTRPLETYHSSNPQIGGE